MESYRARSRGFAFAGSVALAGLLLLLWNLGALPQSYFDVLWPLWPVLLLAAGTNLLLSRIHTWIGSAAALLLLLGTLGTAWGLSAAGTSVVSERVEEPIRVAAQGASALQLDLNIAAGDLTVVSGANPGLLVDGALTTHAGDRALQTSVNDQAGTRRVSLTSDLARRFRIPFFGNHPTETWHLQLLEDVPTEIRLAGGAARVRLDLARLNVKLLDLEIGATDARVTLPLAAGQIRAYFDVGAASLDIRVPADVAAQIQVSGGMSSIDVDENRFPKVGAETYRSPDYDGADNRADITVNAGASSVKIR